MNPDPAFQVNPAPDPIRIQGFDGQKLKKKNTAGNFCINFFRFLWVIFALLDTNTDPEIPLNPDLIRIRIRNTDFHHVGCSDMELPMSDIDSASQEISDEVSRKGSASNSEESAEKKFSRSRRGSKKV